MGTSHHPVFIHAGDDENQDPALKDDEFESLVQDACKSLEDLFDGSIPGSLEGILKINAQIDEMDSAHFFEVYVCPS